jgi:hypothetical protein
MSKNDGGNAFPLHPGILPEWHPQCGMSLRDYFAGQALAGFAFRGLDTTDTAAKLAYAYANAMLAERERKTNAD